MEYRVKNIGLAKDGWNKIRWAESHMPVLMKIKEANQKRRPLTGVRISAVLHVTKETAALVRTLRDLGADVWLAGSNPLSTQDDVAAALAEDGIHVYAWRGENESEYYSNIDIIVNANPNVVMDDGGDLHALLHEKYSNIRIKGGTEETTTGVVRLKAMEESGVLRYPVIAVNNAFTKYLFDNRIGTGQSAIDGILRSTNILLAGKIAVVVGYGWVGRGIATKLKGLGARTIVVEANPFRALEAVMDGFDVLPMDKASKIGDLFVTATGNINVIDVEHFRNMKDGAVLANAGHFNVEIDVKGLKEMSKQVSVIRENLEEYMLENGKRIYLLADGRLVNLVGAEGHPSEVMDLSFSNQALSVIYLTNNSLSNKVINVPEEIDEQVALLKLESMGIEINKMTKEQLNYIKQWKYGT
ncbi:S-adenosyl-L-homocysteine hydrolase [Sulfolobales archaeon HS-7]|nr:S-adenosyl-L-homocysteine hydrolase [Sulfolobales archaeon HS-7]